MSQVTNNTVTDAFANHESAPLASGPEDSHFQLPIRRAVSTLGNIVEDSDDDFLLNLENDSDSRNDSDDESWDAIPMPGIESVDDVEFRSGDVLKSTPEIKPKFSEYDITEFYKSIERGDIAGVQEKLRIGMDVRREADNGLTPLVIAIKTCNIDMVRIMLGSGASSKDFCQQLPTIAYAVMRDERALPILQHLLWSGANASAAFGPEGYNLLHFAIAGDVLGVADFLINEGIDIESTCSKRRTPLMVATEKGHTTIAKMLIAKGADVHRRSESGGTSLMWAVCNGNIELVRIFLDEGIDVNDRDNRGTNALWLASSLGHTEVVKLLLERGAEDINTALLEPTAFTPIMAAAKFDKTDTVKVLIDHKADLTLRSGNYETVLEVAMTAGHFATVRILLEALGGPQYPLDTVALQMAMTNDYAAIRSLMTTAYLMFTELGLKEKVAGSLAWIGWVLEKGGDLVKQRAMSNMMHVALVDKNVPVLKELLLHGYDPNEPIATGHTLLTFAVGARDLKLVEFLLKAGADPSIPARDPHGLNYTPLHQAIVNMDDSSEENVVHADIVMALLASRRCRLMRGKHAGDTVFHYVLKQYANGVYGATKNMSFKMIESIDDLLIDRSDDGSTLMHAAVTYGRQDLIDLLLTKGLRIDVTDDDGMTPFLRECRRNTNMLPYLVRNGANLHKKDHDGQGALHLAARRGRIHVLEFLLDHGMDVDLPTDDRVTPFSSAITSGQEDAALFLLNRGATLHGKTTRHGRSFLHIAASLTMERLVDALLARGVDRGEADINAKDNMGWTALALAVRTGSVGFITTLLDAGADPAIAHDGGNAALHLALIGGNEPVALFLIEWGVSCSARGMWDRTPLHLAAGNHNLLAARALLERGVEVDAIDEQGWTPLLLCSDCTYGDPEIIQLLVDHGADVNYKEPEFEGTPLYHALDRGSVEVFEVLVKAGADWNGKTNGSNLSIMEMIEREEDEELKGHFLAAIEKVRRDEGGRESGKCEKREDRMKGIMERGREVRS